jgi:hypothetical protein
MVRGAGAALLALGLVGIASCEVELEVLASAAPDDAGLEADVANDAVVDAPPDAVTETGGCGIAGARCEGDAECCSGVCDLDATAQVTCRPATGCLGLGQPCAFAGACCTLSCDGACTIGNCASIGELCQTDADCCSHDCAGGSCQGQSLGCLPAGESCAENDDCCGRLCLDTGDGAVRCALRTACRVEGEVCGADSDCCSGACGEIEPGFGFCIPLAACTSGDGKSCSRQVGELCKGDGDCCSRVCLGPPELGKRCAPSGGCRAQCELCTADGECCSGSCLPDASGVLRCAAADGCLKEAEICETDGDCCVTKGKARCSDDPGGPTGARRCHGQDPPAPCLGGEAACALGSACCSELCLPAGGGYACELECMPDGKACTIRADCCGLFSDCVAIDGMRVCAPI